MWIVRLALRRPYTFVVAALLIAILGGVSIRRMSRDIFPEIDIPVVAVIWVYAGITPDDMETRIVGSYERVIFSTVDGIEHVESQSINGISVVKIFLREGADVDGAVAQVVATSQQALKSMPPGIFPPLVMRYNAANVPIVQASLGSDTLTEQEMYDLAINTLRPGMATVAGAKLPWPYGGKVRQIMVDIDPRRLHAWKLSPADVSSAVNAQNLMLPSGSVKIGPQEYNVRINSSPEMVEAIGDLPIRSVGNRTIHIRDVATVRDGFTPQRSIVHVDGKRGVLQPILNAGASTLDIVQGVRDRLPDVLATMPEDLNVTLLSDQSVFVKGAIHGVVVEAAIAAGLTGLMILLFLGSWRSTLIVVISIPLAILTSIVVLDALGHTLNVMTLGGLALAVGILVDDATVEIENIHRNLHQGKRLVPAILDGAEQIAMPAFVSTVCICIVFVPIAFITGTARYLFTPLALAVVFAMIASYLLSRTLVPTMTRYLLAGEVELYGGIPEPGKQKQVSKSGLFWAIHDLFNRQFDRIQSFYGRCLAWALAHRGLVLVGFAGLVAASLALLPLIGRDFFPTVDAGQIRLHVRAPAGTRVEETERHFVRVVRAIRDLIPPEEVETIVDNIGIPNSGINLALSDGTLMSSADGEILITLAHEHTPTADHVATLRHELNQRFPELTFFFLPPDIVTQVLNFGLSAPIDVQLVGPRRNFEENYRIAQELRDRIAEVPGAVDVHLHQVPRTPELQITTDRTLLSQLGVSQRDVANDVLVSLSSSQQVFPNYWLDPKKGIQYPVAVQTPQRIVDSVDALESTPVVPDGNTDRTQLLGNLASVEHRYGPSNVTHYNIALNLDVLANVHGTDLGSVWSGIDTVLDEYRNNLPRGTRMVVRGQVESMTSSFTALAGGLVFAAVLVYLLLVVNFQSWIDPVIIFTALPGAVSGILWMLFVTQTTINVPSLMGAMMCIGVATANAILLVTFANDQRREGRDAHDAAWAAGVTRLRPVVMTASAMILGMLPMSLGMGEGGEQNAPLGRAVIGGLIMATFATLVCLPLIYSLLRRQAPSDAHEAELSEELVTA
ncbi:Multidrug resistance protein MdtC [Maioricimonas rarisocia]|uniref:Multidrug resistance protein MdtC n=1 Tax=Maioricimonas rarisocia TaxID=2528026 RepID=A0A517ZEI4_9PLAN|nr:efflux RND transporter permease subunit [Maioricimonas rarisocia]QDU40923.1 Multidrug resistance protein MdtC [Maioricimonas rarisocia]